MKSKKVAEYRCAHCGRPIKGATHTVPGIGTLGPHCYTKFAAYGRVLEAYDAEDLFITGEMKVREGEGPDRTRQMHALLERLKKGGVHYHVEHGRDAVTQEPYVIVRIKGFPRKQRARRRVLDVWTEWAKEIERRDIERKFGFGEVEK